LKPAIEKAKSLSSWLRGTDPRLQRRGRSPTSAYPSSSMRSSSLIVSQSEIRLLRIIADNPDAFYTWHIDDLSHQTFVCESTIICVDIGYIGKSIEKHGLQRKALEGNVFRIDRTDSDTNFLDLILDELDNAIESDSLPIYSLESYKAAGGVV